MPPIHAMSRGQAEQILRRLTLFASARSGNGFRTPSAKANRWRPFTFRERLLIKLTGQVSGRSRSPRKARKSEARAVYLDRVRDNPKYPQGDRRETA